MAAVLLFIVVPIVCGAYVCYLVHSVLSSLVLIPDLCSLSYFAMLLISKVRACSFNLIVFLIIFCGLCFSCFRVCSLLPFDHAGIGLTSWLLLVMFIAFVLLSLVVFWVRGGTNCIVTRSLPSFLLCNY